MKKPNNNIEFLMDYMEWGSPLNQMFVVDAVIKQAERIVNNEEEVLKSMENNFIHGPAWVQAAKEFLQKLDRFHKRYDKPTEEDEEV